MLLLVWCAYILSIAVMVVFACIMTYPLCMPHDLATANRHDHAWTENWAPNIWMLCTTLSPMQPRNAQRQSDQEDHLYGTKGTWINCPTCFPLLNVGFLTILKRTDCFVLIWACIAVLAVHHNCHFQNCLPLQKRNPQKRKCSSVLPCCSSKRCLLSCMVGLIRLQTSTRVIWFQGYGPCGCQGRRGARVSVRFIASKV